MHFLTGRLSRFGRVTVSRYRDVVKSFQPLDPDSNGRRHPCDNKNITISFNKGKLNFGYFMPLMWTQVRFAAGDGKCTTTPACLHRDYKFPNFDHYRKDQFKDVRKTSWGSGDDKPGYTYVIGVLGLIMGAYGLKGHATHYICMMGPAADVLAMSVLEVDISRVALGQCVAFKWRGKPLFVKHRTPMEIDVEAKTPIATLRDPQADTDRVQRLEWLIIIGICTHLGCVPIANTGDFPGGFYCPCHGSQFDNLGRARKGPAPTNMVVPPYKFLSDTLVLVG